MDTSLPVLPNYEVLHLEKLFLNNVLGVVIISLRWQEDSGEKSSVLRRHIVTAIQILDFSNVHFHNNGCKR